MKRRAENITREAAPNMWICIYAFAIKLDAVEQLFKAYRGIRKEQILSICALQDLAKWPVVSAGVCLLLVNVRPMQTNPKHFSWGVVERKCAEHNWLLYSTSAGSVCCFCCELLNSVKTLLQPRMVF